MFVLQGLPEDWYIKSFLVAGKRIVGKQFEIEPGSADAIVTLSPRGARISIGLEGGAGAAEVFFAALVPDNGEAPDPESGYAAQPWIRQIPRASRAARRLSRLHVRCFELGSANAARCASRKIPQACAFDRCG
jgi:hypothetical protein